mgnify:FL=1
MRFLNSLAGRVSGPHAGSLAPRVFEYALTDDRSKLQKLLHLPALSLANNLTIKYRQEYLDTKQKHPEPEVGALIRSRAEAVALRQLAWQSYGHLKLLPLQLQDYARPHPVAYVQGEEALLIGRWLVNLIPANPRPCSNCDAGYSASRYHMARCSDARKLLGEHYDSVAHLAFFDHTDNVLDPMVMELVPTEERLQNLLASLDRCPGLPRLPDREPVVNAALATLQDLLPPQPGAATAPVQEKPAVWKDEVWLHRVRGIGNAIKEMWRLCRPPERQECDRGPVSEDQAAPVVHHPARQGRVQTQDREPAQDEPDGGFRDAVFTAEVDDADPDRVQGNDRVVPYAFPPEGGINAGGRRASPPVRKTRPWSDPGRPSQRRRL